MTIEHEDYASKILAETARITRITKSREKTGRIIMVTGRGGTGKSTFAALASRYLQPPLLLCDIDPDQSLAAMLGIDLEATHIKTEIGRDVPIKTVSDLTSDIEDEDALLELGGGDLTVKLPLLLQWYAQYRSERFDLISLGPKWTEGDYRSANYLFEFIVPNVGKNYAHIVIDSPAGLEHLNRRVVAGVNDLFVVVDPSAKSLKHVERVKTITAHVGIKYEHLYVVGNHEFDAEAERLFTGAGDTFLGKMAFDPAVREYNLKGKSLWELPQDSPACVSARAIMERAGYKVSL
jgi:CO dehydrogenase maturation factor